RRVCFLRVAPITSEGALALDQKITSALARDLLPCAIQQLRFVARHDAATATRRDLFVCVRDEHLQHLSRADAVEYSQARRLFPFVIERRRQFLASRDAEVERTCIERQPLSSMFEQRTKDCRHGKEDC